MRNDLRPEDDLGLDGKVGIVTGGGAPDDGTPVHGSRNAKCGP
jgi:hypothetical protein